jgi:hypothetical protein
MNIFEQLENAHIMEINGMITTNFGYDNMSWDGDEISLSVYAIDNNNDYQHHEYYFTKENLSNAVQQGEQWKVPREIDVDNFDIITFYTLESMS